MSKKVKQVKQVKQVEQVEQVEQVSVPAVSAEDNTLANRVKAIENRANGLKNMKALSQAVDILNRTDEESQHQSIYFDSSRVGFKLNGCPLRKQTRDKIMEALTEELEQRVSELEEQGK